jgi:hypothetical protein
VLRYWDEPGRTENVLSEYLQTSAPFPAYFLNISGFKTTHIKTET